MQVTEITTRYLRKIQVRDYEPAESEITLKAILLDGDNYETITTQLTEFVQGAVHQSLGLPPSNKIPAGGKTQGVRARGTEAVKTGDGKGLPQQQVSVEVPENGPAKETTAGAKTVDASAIPDTSASSASAIPDSPAPQKSATDAAGIPDSPAPQKPAAPATASAPSKDDPLAGPGELTPGGLSKWVGALVRADKITVQAIGTVVYPLFNVKRLVDLKQDQVAAAKAKIDEVIKTHAESQTL